MQTIPFAAQDAARSGAVNAKMLRQVLIESVSAEDIAAIAQAMVLRARGGDIAAARLVLGYVIGKPGAKAAEQEETEQPKVEESEDQGRTERAVAPQDDARHEYDDWGPVRHIKLREGETMGQAVRRLEREMVEYGKRGAQVKEKEELVAGSGVCGPAAMAMASG